jgi:hypothetical protein
MMDIIIKKYDMTTPDMKQTDAFIFCKLIIDREAHPLEMRGQLPRIWMMN